MIPEKKRSEMTHRTARKTRKYKTEGSPELVIREILQDPGSGEFNEREAMRMREKSCENREKVLNESRSGLPKDQESD